MVRLDEDLVRWPEDGVRSPALLVHADEALIGFQTGLVRFGEGLGCSRENLVRPGKDLVAPGRGWVAMLPRWATDEVRRVGSFRDAASHLDLVLEGVAEGVPFASDIAAEGAGTGLHGVEVEREELVWTPGPHPGLRGGLEFFA